ncbi:MAG: diguanylate cyclase [Snowella sp.]|nr:diguanylate cyclase [Snowella sp.]
MPSTLDLSNSLSSTILFIGESSDEIALLLDELTLNGYAISQIKWNNGIADSVTTNPPDLILLRHDISTEAIQTYQQLIQIKVLEKTPLIFLCCNPEHVDLSLILDTVGTDYLVAPFHPKVAIARINHQLKIAQMQKQLDAQNDHLREITQEFNKIESSLQRVNFELAEVAYIDPHTGLANRPRLEKDLKREWGSSARGRILWGDSTQSQLSLILCCINDFSGLGNHHGNSVMQDYTKQIANLIRHQVKRSADVVASYSQDTFAVLLPHTPQEGALCIVENIRLGIQNLNIFDAEQNLMTLSFGIATAIPSPAIPPETLINVAEQSLKQAIAQGKNQVVCDEF